MHRLLPPPIPATFEAFFFLVLRDCADAGVATPSPSTPATPAEKRARRCIAVRRGALAEVIRVIPALVVVVRDRSDGSVIRILPSLLVTLSMTCRDRTDDSG